MRTDEIREMLEHVGFTEITVTPKELGEAYEKKWHQGFRLEDYLGSCLIRARKATC